MPRSLLVVVAVATTVGVAGCGWIGASSAPHTKPDAFLLRGHVTVPVAAGDSRPVGAACASTVSDIVAGAPVEVLDSTRRLLGTSSLGDGVIAHSATGVSCDFPFQVPHVPGGVTTYDISVSHRPPQRFDAKALRENAEAIITITA